MARWTISRIFASTLGAPLITRDTVARETPAASATWSIVGCWPPRPGRELMRSVIAPGRLAGRALSEGRVPPRSAAAPLVMNDRSLIDADVVDKHLRRERRGGVDRAGP